MKKQEIRWTGCCPTLLFPRISMIIARLAGSSPRKTMHKQHGMSPLPPFHERAARRRTSKTDTSAVFRLFLGYRPEKKVTAWNSPANPLAEAAERRRCNRDVHVAASSQWRSRSERIREKREGERRTSLCQSVSRL